MITSLIIMQPDFGMTILIASAFFCQLFVAGLSILFIFISLIILILLGFVAYYLLDHVKKRVIDFF